MPAQSPPPVATLTSGLSAAQQPAKITQLPKAVATVAATNPIWFVRLNAAGAVTGGGYSPDGTLPKNSIACTQAQAAVAGPWSSIVNGVLVVGAQSVSVSKQVRNLLGAGLTVTSTSTPVIDGTYATDSTTISHLQSEMLSILAAGTFADGAGTLIWPDISGTMHVFPSVEVFKNFAVAMAAFVAAAAKVKNGSIGVLPNTSVTIA
jgi:hypothetical protein